MTTPYLRNNTESDTEYVDGIHEDGMRQLPEVFFKYQSIAAGKASLTNQTLRWSTPATLNDPFDMQFDLATEVNDQLVCSLALEKLWQAYIAEAHPLPKNPMAAALILLRLNAPGMSREDFCRKMEPGILEGLDKGRNHIPKALSETRDLMSTSKILCLSEVGDNPLMWAHYAESHRGICLMLAPVGGNPYTLAKPIEYVDKVPALFDEQSLSDLFSGRVNFQTTAALDKIVYSKSQVWSYEREWRVFAGDGRNKSAAFEDCPFGSEELVGIILGARISGPDELTFSALASKINPDVSIYRASLDAKFCILVNRL